MFNGHINVGPRAKPSFSCVAQQFRRVSIGTSSKTSQQTKKRGTWVGILGIMEDKGLTRKEKLELWRARKGEAAAAPQPRPHHPGKSKNLSSGKVILAARPGASNFAKEPVSRKANENVARKSFQVRASQPPSTSKRLYAWVKLCPNTRHLKKLELS